MQHMRNSYLQQHSDRDICPQKKLETSIWHCVRRVNHGIERFEILQKKKKASCIAIPDQWTTNAMRMSELQALHNY